MRSRAELLLRLIGIAAILAWVALALVPRGGGHAVGAVASLGSDLPRWTRDPGVRTVHVQLDTLPDAATASWLAALRRAGVAVTWEGDVAPLAVETWRAAGPSGEVVVLATAGGDVVLRDALGALDTLRGGETSVRLASVEGDIAITTATQSARTGTAPARASKAVYVAGAAGWEGKFLVAALEEAGWRVDARLFVAPGKDVVQGRTGVALDTAGYSAVILLDSAAAEAVRGVEGFVRSGGGAVLAGTASRGRRVAPLVAWRAGARVVAPLGTMGGDTAWRGLSRVPLTLSSAGGALPLEVRGSAAAVAARRHHAGRVAAVGYDETWRWRMTGGPSSVAEHRAWWAGIVSSVAARPAAIGEETRTGAAPVAALHEILGPPTGTAFSGGAPFPRDALANLLGLLALAALLGEWLLRRTRGAR